MTFGYDFSEATEMGDFVTLTPGRYIFALQSVEKGTSDSGNPKAVLRFRVVAGNPAYEGGIISAHWPVTGKGAFRFRAMLKAFGVKFTDKGKVNLEKYIDSEFGARVTLTEGRERNEAGEIVYFHELNAILPASQYSDLLGDREDEEDEEEDEDVEEEEVEEEDDDEDGEDEVTVEDIEGMDLAELKELAEEWEVSTEPDKGKSKLTSAQMRKRLIAVIEAASEDEEEDEDEEEEEEGDEDELTLEDLEAMNLTELKEVAQANDVKLPKVKPGKKLTAAMVRTKLAAALFPDADEEDEEPF